jgi:hypothetical protein
MSTFLLVLQAAALLFAAAAAAASLLKSKGFEETEIHSPIIGAPKKTTRRLTREAKMGVLMVSAGLVVSFAAKIIEQTTTNKRNVENQQTTSNQLVLLQTSLQELRRLAQQIRTLDSDITIRIVGTNAGFLRLRDYLAQRVSLYEGTWPEGMGNELVGGPGVHLRALAQRAIDDRRFMTSSDWLDMSGSYVEWWDGANNQPRIKFTLISDSRPTALASESCLRPVYLLLQTLGSKACQLRFCSDIGFPISTNNGMIVDEKRAKSDGIDYMFVFNSKGQAIYNVVFHEFLCAFSPQVREAQLDYDTISNEILLHFSVRFPEENWERHHPTISFSDLSQCSIFLLLPNLIGEEPSKAKVEIQLLIDGARVIPPDVRSIQRPLTFGLPGSWGLPRPGTQITEDLWSSVPVFPDTSFYKTAELPDLDRP